MAKKTGSSKKRTVKVEPTGISKKRDEVSPTTLALLQPANRPLMKNKIKNEWCDLFRFRVGNELSALQGFRYGAYNELHTLRRFV